MATKPQKTNKRHRQATFSILMLGLILVCVNILASYFHAGLDLTREKRFTLSGSTKTLLSNMKEVAVIDVYMEGKFPADVQRMQESVRERLVAFKEIAGNKIIYRFIDPIAGKSEKEQKQIFMDLGQKGIKPIPVESDEDEGYSVKVMVPYALLHYNGDEMPINLLESPPGKDRLEQISYAEALLEYKLASAIAQLSRPRRPRIGYMLGHNEEIGLRSVEMLRALAMNYDLDSINLKYNIHISNSYDAIVINQPTIPFTEPEKLKLDQFIMRGGKVLWIVNNMNASMDSFAAGTQKFLSVERGLNIDDLLFHYGMRVNNDIVEDLQNVPIGLMTGGPSPTLYDWVYFPRINPTSEHPIVRNMNFILGKFTNSIDTILTSGIKKTILLQTSKYSRTAGSPVTVSMTKVNFPGKPENYNKPYRAVAILAEGKFHSLYQNRLAPSYLRLLDSLNEPFKAVCDSSTSMIVTTIGDVFMNDVNSRGATDLGYYKFTPRAFYANKSFLLNCMEYLTDKTGVLEARSKDVKPRLLDRGRVKEETTMWQYVNVGIPIALVLVFASAYTFFRKRRYEVKANPKTN